MKPLRLIRKNIKKIPKMEGVYLLFNKDKELLYVGESTKLPKRIDYHMKTYKNAFYFSYVVMPRDPYWERARIEKVIIRKLKPKDNNYYRTWDEVWWPKNQRKIEANIKQETRRVWKKIMKS